MEKLYAEGLAIRGGPESCAGACEGDGEALTGARAGRAMEPRNTQFGVPTPSPRWKATRPVALCEALAGPARSKNHGMYGTSKRENRDIPLLAHLADHRTGRSGNAKAVSLG